MNPTRILGKIEGCDFPLPSLSVKIIHPKNAVVLAEVTSNPQGYFAFILDAYADPPFDELEFTLEIRLVDGSGSILHAAPLELKLGQAVEVAIPCVFSSPDDLVAVPLTVPAENLLNPAHTDRLLRDIHQLVESGDLKADFEAQAEGLVSGLMQVDDLLPDARAAMAGNSDAANRLRFVLTQLGQAYGRQARDAAVLFAGAPFDANQADGLANIEALETLVFGSVWAAETSFEAQTMLDGLVGLINGLPLLEQLDGAVRSARQDSTGQHLRSIRLAADTLLPFARLQAPLHAQLPQLPAAERIGALLPGLGRGPLPLPGPGGGLPIPNKPCSPPFHIDPHISSNDSRLEFPIISMHKDCDRANRLAFELLPVLKGQIPPYHIQSISDPLACPGSLITLKGTNFGSAGKVLFPAGNRDPHKHSVQPRSVTAQFWSGSEIRVVVPDWAAPGSISLEIYERTVHGCTNFFQLFRPGNAIPFSGGVPEIYALTVNGRSDPQVVEPGSPLRLGYQVSPGETVRVSLDFIDENGVSNNLVTGGPGGTREFTLTAPNVTTPTELRLVARASNHCGGDETLERSFWVAARPNLAILGVEFTQAVQFFAVDNPASMLNNSLPLVARRRTIARVYVDSGLTSGFTYGTTPNEIPGVSGKLKLWKNGQLLAEISPINTVTAPEKKPTATGKKVFARNAAAIQKGDATHSLNFELPWNLLTGWVETEVEVSVPNPFGARWGNWSHRFTGTRVQFQPRRSLRVAVVPVTVRGSAPGSISGLEGIADRYPLAEDGIELKFFPPVASERDLTAVGEWYELWNDIGELSESWEHSYDVLVGIVPQDDTYALNGTANATQHWPPVCLSKNGLAATIAHEIAHTLKVKHAASVPGLGCGNPRDVDPQLDSILVTEGMLVRKCFAFPSDSPDLMTYCTPSWSKADYQDRWTSRGLWLRLFQYFA